MLSGRGRGRRIEVMPHYHCNFEGEPNPLNGTHSVLYDYVRLEHVDVVSYLDVAP